jgi:hypothetical protein
MGNWSFEYLYLMGIKKGTFSQNGRQEKLFGAQ